MPVYSAWRRPADKAAYIRLETRLYEAQQKDMPPEGKAAK